MPVTLMSGEPFVWAWIQLEAGLMPVIFVLGSLPCLIGKLRPGVGRFVSHYTERMAVRAASQHSKLLDTTTAVVLASCGILRSAAVAATSAACLSCAGMVLQASCTITQ